MTRQEKAAAAFGSTVAVSLFLFVAWSVLGALVVLIAGVAATVAVLRATHPLGAARPTWKPQSS
jgi:hypothetical protein